jgi:hypothetical protein
VTVRPCDIIASLNITASRMHRVHAAAGRVGVKANIEGREGYDVHNTCHNYIRLNEKRESRRGGCAEGGCAGSHNQGGTVRRAERMGRVGVRADIEGCGREG